MFRKSVLAILLVALLLVVLLPEAPAYAAGTVGRTGIWVCRTPRYGCKVYNTKGQLERARAWALTGKVKSGKIWTIRYLPEPHNVWAYRSDFTWVGD